MKRIKVTQQTLNPSKIVFLTILQTPLPLTTLTTNYRLGLLGLLSRWLVNKNGRMLTLHLLYINPLKQSHWQRSSY